MMMDKKKTNKKVISNKSKHVQVENELKKLKDKIEKLQTFDSSLLMVKTTFSIMDHNFTLYFNHFNIL